MAAQLALLQLHIVCAVLLWLLFLENINLKKELALFGANTNSSWCNIKSQVNDLNDHENHARLHSTDVRDRREGRIFEEKISFSFTIPLHELHLRRHS